MTKKIPKEWKLTALSNVVEKIVDNRGKTPPFNLINGYKLIETWQITIGNKYPSTEHGKQKYVDEDTYKTWFRSGHPQNKDILFSTVGESVPQFCFAPDNEEVCIAQNLIGIRPNKDIVDPVFLLSFFKTRYFVQSVKNRLIVTAQPSIKVPHLMGIDILVPSIHEQRAIANVLSAIDDKIELLREQNNTLNAIAKATFRRWFENFDFLSEDGKPYKSIGKKMFDSELGEIPEGWRVGKLTEMFDFMEGPGIRNWQYAESGRRFINIRLIQDGDIIIKDANFISEEEAESTYKHFHLQDRDMVVSTSGTLGRSAIVRKEHLPLMLNTSVIRFRPIDKCSYGFMYLFLNSRFFQNELESLASGSVQLNFGPVHLKQIEMIIPSTDVLRRFAELVNPIYKKISFNLSQIETLSGLRDCLLPKLMRGELRVKGFNG